MKATLVPPVRVFCFLCLTFLLVCLAGAPALADQLVPAPEPAARDDVPVPGGDAPPPAGGATTLPPARSELPSSYMAPDVPLLAMPNPAATYCENLGYEYVVVEGEDGQRGVCVLPDGREVDAWEFYRGKVAPEYSYCARQGLSVRTKTQDHGSFTTECAVCVSEGGEELGEVGRLMGLSFGTVGSIAPGRSERGGSSGGERHVPKRLAAPFGASPPSLELPAKLDWRTMDGTTAVKAQGNCGSCWAFSTVGAMECNILIKDGVEVDLSEQWLVSCNQSGWSCGGGGFAHGYHMLKRDPCGDSGAVLENDFYYQAWNAPCDCPYPHSYWLEGWGFIDKSVDITPTEKIKRAIMTYGPVSAGVLADAAFSSYSGGVFTGGNAYDINHAIVLVGWDDNQGPEGVWFLRNSWGMMWGENGYMRIAYGRNAVGWTANWVEYRDPIKVVLEDVNPGVVEPGTPVTMHVRIEEHSDTYLAGTGVMHYRLDSGRYDVVQLEALGGGLYEATVPAAACGDTLEFFFAASGLRYGTVYDPRHPALGAYRCPVGETALVMADNFETDTGWTVQNGLELVGGAWERGVPAGGGDRSDPPTDFDGSGSCFLTGNTDGDSDVDKDYTRLISPVFDLSGGDEAVIEFAYWYRNDRGDNPNGDFYITCLSDDGGTTWVPADTIGPRAPLPSGWRRKTLVVGEHVELTDQVRVRVEVDDQLGGSLVEAAIDDFSVSYIGCDSAARGIEDADASSSVALLPNAPNPFGPSTVIRYELPRPAPVLLTVHTASGRIVRTLVRNEQKGVGPHAVRWDGLDDRGRRVAAGTYFYRLEAGGETLTAKMVLLK